MKEKLEKKLFFARAYNKNTSFLGQLWCVYSKVSLLSTMELDEWLDKMTHAHSRYLTCLKKGQLTTALYYSIHAKYRIL